MTGNHVKRLREKMGLTQKEFCKVVGLRSYYRLSAIENGRAKLSGPLKKVCEMLEKNALTK